jgi:hypothetical protein
MSHFDAQPGGSVDDRLAGTAVRAHSRAVAALNDRLRTSGLGGQVMASVGLVALGDEFVAQVLTAVCSFSSFTPDNDPYGEHDFGTVDIGGQSVVWKIDYYDRSMRFGSENPADEAVTTRVMTVMLAEDY